MQLTFQGAAQTVTGSKHILTTPNGEKILLDCGLFQGGGIDTVELNKHFGFAPTEIAAMVLSHAHIDHSGLIPRLVKEGYQNPIYCTAATLDLAEILLRDSANIQKEDTFYSNKKREERNEPLIEPLYTMDDVDDALEFFVVVEIGESFKVTDEVTCTLTEAGHILGSAVVNLTVRTPEGTENITFSGDIGRYNDPILRAPAVFPQADYIICESTYGDRLHDDLALCEDQLLQEIIYTCIQKKGRLIIPSFSVGRTQELIYALNRLDIANRLPDIDFYVDSPLSYNATAVTEAHTECYNDSMMDYIKTDHRPFEFPNLTYITDVEDSKALNRKKGPCVIISASGMADSGRVKHHIMSAIDKPENTILFVGYCEPSSIGGKLLAGAKEIKIFRNFYAVNIEIRKIESLSAHGDYNDIIRFLSCQDPAKVKKFFVVHGELPVQEVFKTRLLQKGFAAVEIPTQHQTFDLSLPK